MEYSCSAKNALPMKLWPMLMDTVKRKNIQD